MNQSEHDVPEDRSIGDFSRTTLPRKVVAIVIALTFLPITLNIIGIRFSAVRAHPQPEDTTVRSVEEILEEAEVVNRGKSIYVLLEWTAFTVALATAVFALAHYSVA